jgi:hypothetical protein
MLVGDAVRRSEGVRGAYKYTVDLGRVPADVRAYLEH